MKPERKLPARFLVAHSAFGDFIADDRDTAEWVADQLRLGVFEPRQVIEEGTFLDLDTRAPKSDKVQAQLRALLLGTDADLQPNTLLASTPSLFLIPDWWPACAVMQLTGPAKAGKTYDVVDILRTLVDSNWLSSADGNEAPSPLRISSEASCLSTPRCPGLRWSVFSLHYETYGWYLATARRQRHGN